jgi:hypothetical protein
MTKPFTPKVVTANALLEGDVIYLQADDNWSRNLKDAEILTDEAHADLRLIEAHAGNIVGPYLAEIKVNDGIPEPIHFREEFRTRGPSNYDHGKQVELN